MGFTPSSQLENLFFLLEKIVKFFQLFFFVTYFELTHTYSWVEVTRGNKTDLTLYYKSTLSWVPIGRNQLLKLSQNPGENFTFKSIAQSLNDIYILILIIIFILANGKLINCNFSSHKTSSGKFEQIVHFKHFKL